MIRTVQELINALEELEDKSLPIYIYHPDYDILPIFNVDDSVDGRIDLNLDEWE